MLSLHIWLICYVLALSLNIYIINFRWVYSLEQCLFLTAFKSILSQSRCSLEPKNFLRGALPPKCPAEGLRLPPSPPALLTLAKLAFLLIMFAPGIISIFFSNVPSWVFLYASCIHKNGMELFCSAKKVISHLVSLSNDKGATIYRR